MQKFICEPSSDCTGYVIARYNEIRKEYESLRMRPLPKDIIDEIVKEINLIYKEDCSNCC